MAEASACGVRRLAAVLNSGNAVGCFGALVFVGFHFAGTKFHRLKPVLLKPASFGALQCKPDAKGFFSFFL